MDGDDSNQNNQSGEYVVVARRYRPQAFGDLIGQGMVAQALKNAITTDRVGHAYLFTGARGVGKTSTARILAKALNCSSGPTTDPCGHCDICLQIASGDDVDVLEIDGASNRGIDEIRQLRSNVGIRPSRSRFKVYIIDEVHMLTKEAFNALLKTLEEPPEHVKFIFCTTEPGKIPITVLSRCQRFDFSPVDTEDIARRLSFIVESEGASAESEALELLARRAAGSMRDSQSLLEQLLSFVGNKITVDDVHSMFGTAKADRVTALLQRLIDRDAAGVLSELQTTLHQGVVAGQLAEQLVTCLRDVMACTVGCDPNLLLFHSPSDADTLRAHGEQWGIETLLAALQILDQTVTRMRLSVHGRILLEMALVRIANLEDLDLLSQLATQVSAGAPVQIERPAKKKPDDRTTTTPKIASTSASPPPAPSDGLSTPSSPTAELPTTTSQASAASPAEAVSATDPESVSSAGEDSHSVSPSTPPRKQQPIGHVDTNAPNDSHSECSSDVNVGDTAIPENQDQPSSDMDTAPGSDAELVADSQTPTVDVAESLPESEADNSSTASSDNESSESRETPQNEAQSENPIGITELTESTAKRVWETSLGLLSDMTADFAAHASDVAISAPNRLVVKFLGRYNASKAYCERPEKRAALEEALQKVTGNRIRIEFSVTRDDAAHETPSAPVMSTQQLKRKIASHPLVETTVKLFEAQILTVEPAKRPT